MSLMEMIRGLIQPNDTASAPNTGSMADMFRPILEAVAQDAKRRADPMSRIGDVGSAIFDSLSNGTPYGQNLAARDTQRTSALSGAGNLFLTLMGQERQIKQAENESAYRTATLAQGERRIGLEERRLAQDQYQPMQVTSPSGATRIVPFNKKTGVLGSAPVAPPSARADIPTYLAQLDDEGRTILQDELNKDAEYKTAPTQRQAQIVEERAREIFRARRGSLEQRSETADIIRPPQAGETPPPNLSGKALIDWLSKSPDYGPQYARNVQMAGDYDGKIPAMYGRKPELLLHFKGLLSQYNPDFQEDKYDRRRQAEKAFQPGGQTYANITNIRQIFPHLETLTKAVDALNSGDFRPLNAATAVVRKGTGSPAITNMEQAARVVGLEAMRVFRQVGASEAEALDFAKTLSTANSPAQLAGVIGQLHEQLGARLKAHSEAYKEATKAPSRPEGREFDMLPGDLGRAEKKVSEWVKKRVGAELTPEQLSDPAQRVKGAIYKTPKGALLWDGEKWVKPR